MNAQNPTCEGPIPSLCGVSLNHTSRRMMQMCICFCACTDNHQHQPTLKRSFSNRQPPTPTNPPIPQTQMAICIDFENSAIFFLFTFSEAVCFLFIGPKAFMRGGPGGGSPTGCCLSYSVNRMSLKVSTILRHA